MDSALQTNPDTQPEVQNFFIRHRKAAALAATIMIMPGGFILGATLAGHYYLKRRSIKKDRQSRATSDHPILEMES